MSKNRAKSDTLSAQQEHACRLRVLDGKTYNEVCDVLGLARDTVWRWTQLPAWEQYTNDLRQQMHDGTINAHKATAIIGAAARAHMLRELRRDFDEADSLRDRVAIAATVDRLTTSAEDRAGYPKTERREVETTTVTRYDDLTPEELDAEAEKAETELRVIMGGKA